MDRVATPWLILRFIDAEEEFSLIPWFGAFEGPVGAIRVGVPGAELGPHDDSGTCFDKVARKYAIDDPAVIEIGKVVAAGVAYLLKGMRPQPEDRLGQIGVGLLAISDGMMIAHETDSEIIDANLPIYDALYARFKTEHLLKTRGLDQPDHRPFGPGARNELLRALLAEPW